MNPMMSTISTTAATSLIGMLCSFSLPSGSQLGTGGFATKSGAELKHIWVDVRRSNVTSILNVWSAASQVISGLTPEGNLAHIESVLNPSVTELSILLNVSRQAIYEWKKGNPIHTVNAEKVRGLALAANAFADKDVQFVHHILRRKIGGRNFFARVGEGEVASEVTRKLLEIARIEQQQREMISAQLKDRPRRIDIIEVPGRHYQDENG